MASFADVASQEPEFATRVRAAFDAQEHTFLATLRRDGSPRISRTGLRFVGGEPWLAGMPGSVTFTDLRRDPRFALHSGSGESEEFPADATLTGHAYPVTDHDERADYATRTGGAPGHLGFELFRVELDQVALLELDEERTTPVLTSWRPSSGLTRTARI